MKSSACVYAYVWVCSVCFGTTFDPTAYCVYDLRPILDHSLAYWVCQIIGPRATSENPGWAMEHDPTVKA